MFPKILLYASVSFDANSVVQQFSVVFVVFFTCSFPIMSRQMFFFSYDSSDAT
jgi:hypothetical protein